MKTFSFHVFLEGFLGTFNMLTGTVRPKKGVKEAAFPKRVTETSLPEAPQGLMFPGLRTLLDRKPPRLRAPERLCLTTQKLRTHIPAACQGMWLRKTGSSDDQEETGVRGKGSPLIVFSKKKKKYTYCSVVISSKLDYKHKDGSVAKI